MHVQKAHFVSGVAAVSLAAGALLAAPAAVGQGGPNTVALDGGETRLHLNAGTAKALTGAGIRVTPSGSADATGSRVDFPITGGEIVPNTGLGTYDHDGSGLRLSGRGARVNLANLVVNSRTGDLTAQVGGRRIIVGNLLTGNAAVIRRGPGRVGTWLVRVQVNLSRPAATALNAAFDTNLFRAGLRLGRADVRSAPLEVILDGGSTRLTTSAAANAALQSLGVSVATVPPAAADTQGRLNFPIDGRKVDIAETSGRITHEGGVAFSAGATTVQLTDLEIDLGADVFPVPSLVALVDGNDPAPIFSLDTSTTKVGVSAQQLVATEVGLDLTATAAQGLNTAFGVTAFAEGLDFGTARVQARVR